MPHQLTDDDLARLRLAAEDAAWLIERGSAQVKHHIARELDPEDVARRPLRIDAASVIATVEAALDGAPLLETPAGVLIDPGWRRSEHQPGANLQAALTRVLSAVASLRPKAVHWVVDERAEQLLAALASHKKVGRAKAEVVQVADVVTSLRGAAFVASSDPAVLDEVGTWVNGAALALSNVDGPRLRLHGE
jgi:hypothetical protein